MQKFYILHRRDCEFWRFILKAGFQILDDTDDDNDGQLDSEDYDDDGDGIPDTEDEDHPDFDDENDEL